MTQPLRIAIAGLGTVGTSVVAILEEHRQLLAARTGREIVITAVSARSKDKERSVSIRPYRFEADPLALALAGDVDVVVELMGGAEGIARSLIEAALKNGKHVVTANKALIATYGTGLSLLAQKNALALAFEAAVAGGIPIVKLLREGLAGNEITRIMGILNGTCNYIFTHMWEDKREMADVLAEAQQLGYAEADPSFDIDGVDAAHKLAILTALAYGATPDLTHISIEGIRGITLRDMQFADELGYAIRLLAIGSRHDGAVLQRVHPCLVAKGSSLASVRGVYNAVQLEGDEAGTIFIQGQGAGGTPTASAVVADIADIARGHRMPPFMSSAVLPAASIDMLESGYYVRMTVADKPGVLADITAGFRDCGISVKSFVQRGPEGERITIVFVTHNTRESELQRALITIGKQPGVVAAPFAIRINEL